jgi:hypothetical protein
MFRALRLIDAFESLATPEEWNWFGPMAARRTMHFGNDGWPLFEFWKLQAFPRLWKKLSDKALQKLQDGEWVAEGISPSFGPQPVQIDTNLWDYLQIIDRAEQAEGAGFHFIALTVTEVRCPRITAPLAEQPRLRRQLADWIKAQASSGRGPVKKADLLEEARRAFEGKIITQNMFRDARRDADLPASFVVQGRPKA